jgi:signal recognition particle subunit SRP68
MQSAHGLRHDDYKQYHEYCTRRLSRIRHNREVRKELVHSAAYVSGEKTRKHAYIPRDLPEDLNHENMLLVVLVDAERAWAHSCELKALLHEQLPKNHEKAKAAPGSIRQHALRRLRRAQQLAIRFEDLCGLFSDVITQEEAKAYASWMRGNFALEVNDWKVRLTARTRSLNYCFVRYSLRILNALQTACAEFQESISLCSKLAQMEDDLETSDLFTGRANNVLKPLLKYCQYEWKETGGDVLVEFEDGEKGGSKNESAGAGSVSYRGQSIIVENKSLKVLLLKAESLLASTNGADDEEDETFVSLLSMFDDAHGMVSADLQKFRQMKAGPAVNSKRIQLEQLSGYIRYQKLQLSMKRHELMVASCDNAADSAHLYDALLHDAKAVCELPGPEEEDEFFLEANANVLRVRAFRAFYVAQLYMSLNKFTEALALMKQAKILADRASEEVAACDDLEHADTYLEDLDLLMNDIAEMTMRIEARSYLGLDSSSVTGDILSNLDDFVPNNNLTDLSPIPAPAKPTFFDVAWNHASSYPHEELKQFMHQNKPKGSGGLMGWFRSS